MTDFIKLLEEEESIIEEAYDTALLEFIEENYDEDYDALAEDLEVSLEEATEFVESLRKHVDAAGTLTKKRSRAYRSRHAAQTTGLSKAQLKLRGRRAAKSRKRNPSGLKVALRKRKKAMTRRKRMGL